MRVPLAARTFHLALFLCAANINTGTASDCTDWGSHLRVANSVALPGEIRGIDGEGDLLGCVNFYGGVELFDISDPDDPSPLAALSLDPPTLAINLDGSRMFVAHGLETCYLSCYDLANPSAPVFRSSLALGSATSQAIAASGDLVYVANWDGGIDVVDVSNLTAPYVVGNVTLPGHPLALHLEGDRLYVGAYGFGLVIVDVSDPALPLVRGTYGGITQTQSVVFHSGVLYLSDSTSIRLFDVSNPDLPQAMGNLPREAYDLLASGDVLLAGAWGRVSALDLSSPTEPALVGSVPTLESPLCLFAVGTHAYLGHLGGFDVVDFSEPSSPAQVRLELPQYTSPRAVVVRDDLAYVAAGSSGLLIVSLASGAPELVGSAETLAPARDVALYGGYAIAAETTNLEVIDIGNPASPSVVATLPIQANEVSVSGNRAFVASGYGGLSIVDLSDPLHPQLLGVWDSPGSVVGAQAIGHRAYVTDSVMGLVVLAVINPAAPVVLHSLALGLDVIRGIEVDEERICVHGAAWAWGQPDLLLFDREAPQYPQLRGSLQVPGEPLNVEFQGTWLYSAQMWSGGISLIDLSELNHPVLAGGTAMPFSPTNLALHGDQIFVADSFASLLLIDGQCLPANAESEVSPGRSPLSIRLDRSGGELRFRLESRVNEVPGLSLYDLQGRLVRALSPRPVGVGRAEAVWDRRTGGGAPAPAGVYFARGTVTGASAAVRVVLHR
ncbi:MAG: hypothetical protein IPK72_25100 [Candidatus Eisenbacteria bacterium]|nr:hypothetical protein [Candidatus Eisenbacteria bacterium]